MNVHRERMHRSQLFDLFVDMVASTAVYSAIRHRSLRAKNLYKFLFIQHIGLI